MYCILKFVTKSLYGIAPPFSILSVVNVFLLHRSHLVKFIPYGPNPDLVSVPYGLALLLVEIHTDPDPTESKSGSTSRSGS